MLQAAGPDPVPLSKILTLNSLACLLFRRDCSINKLHEYCIACTHHRSVLLIFSLTLPAEAIGLSNKFGTMFRFFGAGEGREASEASAIPSSAGATAATILVTAKHTRARTDTRTTDTFDRHVQGECQRKGAGLPLNHAPASAACLRSRGTDNAVRLCHKSFPHCRAVPGGIPAAGTGGRVTRATYSP